MMSGPPLASSLATPPEFYLDENAGTRSVRRHLEELGLRARVQVFLLPGEARVDQMLALIDVGLAGVCAITACRSPGTWRLTRNGREPYPIPGKRKSTKRN